MKDFFLRRARQADLDPVLELIAESSLPVEGVAENFDTFVVAENGFKIVGAVGLELYGRYALLRSAAVAKTWHGFGIGRALVGEIISQARTRNIETVFLLTTTAENYFPSFGFVKVGRSDVPDELLASRELQGACSDSATVMRLAL